MGICDAFKCMEKPQIWFRVPASKENGRASGKQYHAKSPWRNTFTEVLNIPWVLVPRFWSCLRVYKIVRFHVWKSMLIRDKFVVCSPRADGSRQEFEDREHQKYMRRSFDLAPTRKYHCRDWTKRGSGTNHISSAYFRNVLSPQWNMIYMNPFCLTKI